MTIIMQLKAMETLRKKDWTIGCSSLYTIFGVQTYRATIPTNPTGLWQCWLFVPNINCSNPSLHSFPYLPSCISPTLCFTVISVGSSFSFSTYCFPGIQLRSINLILNCIAFPSLCFLWLPSLLSILCISNLLRVSSVVPTFCLPFSCCILSYSTPPICLGIPALLLFLAFNATPILLASPWPLFLPCFPLSPKNLGWLHLVYWSFSIWF